MASNKPNSGFTLIELIVVISVTVLLSGLLIGYTRTGEKQITLVTEQAKLIGVILRAKTLALQSFKEGGAAPCGLGIHLSPPNKYLIFKKLKPPLVGCDAASNKQYLDSSEIFQEFTVAEGINFSVSPQLSDIFFLPPDPKVFFDGQEPPPFGSGPNEANITLSVDAITLGVKVNKMGQITTQYSK